MQKRKANPFVQNLIVRLDYVHRSAIMATQMITYLRVSTARQGRSGLGLEAQRQALARFAEAEGFNVAREFVEVETGKGSDALSRRPQLAAALAAARKLKC